MSRTPNFALTLALCAAVLAPAAATHAVEITLANFNNSGFDWTFGDFMQQTGPTSVRLFDTVNGEGGAGFNSSTIDLSAYTGFDLAVDLSVNGGNGSDQFEIEWKETGIDTGTKSAKFLFNLSSLSTGVPTTLVSTTNLGNPQTGNGQYFNMDWSDIERWQLNGQWQGSQPFDIQIDRVYLTDSAPNPPPYPGAEPDAAWRTQAETQIDQYRKADLNVTVTGAGGAPVSGADVHAIMTGHEFKFGTAVQARRLSNLSPNDEPDDTTYRNTIAQLFNTATFENSMKWPPWDGQWGGSYDQAQTMAGIDWMEANGIAPRGHTMVWGGYNNLPSNVQNLINQWDAAPGSQKPAIEQQIRDAIEDHIRDISQATAGRIDDWDVVNEPRAQNDLINRFGDDIMEDWFQWAEQENPDSALYINEYNIVNSQGGTSTPTQNTYYNTIQDLVNGGAPLSGVGIQGHFQSPSTLTGPVALWDIFDRFDDFGVPIQITEFDYETTDEELQAMYMRDFMTAVFAHPALDAFIQWGFWEGAHWRPDAALYDSNWNIKPNGEAYLDLVFNEWWTDETDQTNGSGEVSIRGFKGSYDLELSHEGIVQLHSNIDDLSDGGLNLVLPLADGTDGAVDADVVNMTGYLDVAGDDATGTLDLLGNDYTQQGGASIEFELGPGGFDAVLGGDISLGGTLVLDLIGGFTPLVGQMFTIIDADTLSGAFSSVVEPTGVDVDVTYNYASDQVILEVLSVLTLPGDADFDGDVDLDDYNILSGNMYTAVAGGAAEGDFDNNGFVDFSDFVIQALHFGDTLVLEAPGSLPEPTTLTLMLLAGATTLTRPCRRVA